MKKILVLGASGMLGNAVMRIFAADSSFEAWGTVRSTAAALLLPESIRPRALVGVDVEQFDSLAYAFAVVRPDIVINCIGVVKQLAQAEDPLTALPINSMLPHRLARLCAIGGARLVHISTDCVFTGDKGGYMESDTPDAVDLYGRSKLLGELEYPHTITLRTSIIGHELAGSRSLLNWFLAQSGSVRGFTKAVFSGLPTVELARVIRDHVIPKPELHGLFHVSSAPIAKFDLLQLFAATYGKSIEIRSDDSLVIDRSLNSARFTEATGYLAPAWPELVNTMAKFG